MTEAADTGRRGGGLGLWAFRMLLVYVCILLTQPQNRFTFLWPLHIADLSFIAAVGLHVLACMQEGRPLLRMGPGTVTGLILLAMVPLSLAFGAFSLGFAWNNWVDMFVKNALLLILLEAMLTSKERVWAAQMTTLVATFYWLKAGLRLAAAGATYSGDRMMGAAIGLIENPNSLAYMMCFYLPLYLYACENSKAKWERWGYFALLFSAVYVIFKTGSRTGLVGLLVLGAFMLPRQLVRNLKGLVLAVVAVAVLLPMSGEKNIQRFKTIPQSMSAFFSGKQMVTDRPLTQDEQSAEDRRWKNKHTWGLIKRHPVFGAGLNPDQLRFPPDLPMAKGQVHCEILAMGIRMGMPGMVLYVAMWVVAAVCGLKTMRRMKWWPAMGNLGWIFFLQTVVLVVGGSFCPLPCHPPMMVLVASAAAMARLCEEDGRGAGWGETGGMRRIADGEGKG